MVGRSHRMGPGDTLIIAARGLGRHWVRAALNVVGILAGVASTVLLIAVAHGVSESAKATVQGLGSDLVVVYPSALSASGVQLGLGSTSSITEQDVQALGDKGYVPDGLQAVATAAQRLSVDSLDRRWDTDLLGSTEGFASARGYTMREGRFFSAIDTRSSASVVILGQTVVDNDFAGTDPVGRLVRINNHPFRVIGVFNPRGYSGTFNQDDVAVTPITAAWAYVIPSTAPRVQQVIVQSSSTKTTSVVKDEITNTLLQRHHITNPAKADFQVRTQQDLVASSQRLGTVAKWMLAVIAAISLLTGGIGVMSLMLASVGERTAEIGIRRAVGAERRQVLSQFLIEALLLACAGGILGIAIGLGAASTMASVLSDLPPPIITVTAILVAAGVALAVGVGAGIYPAIRAARLQPAEAVRRL